MAKAMIGMSGGVDSSVAAWLMKDAGYECSGCTMALYDTEGSTGAQDAQAVADRLGIPFLVLDRQEQFRQQVVDHFISCYRQGLTPNPCIRCNRKLKFGAMLQAALELGQDYIVTGHYARIRYDEAAGRYLLYKALDANKDQTYFLACLDQHQLAHSKFPLGELTKDQVRQIAREQGFLNAHKKDSQDICFIPDGDYYAFLRSYTGQEFPEGDYLDREGRVVGRHKGAAAYTLGQRKGLGIALGEPVYVTGKDMAANTVTLGPNEALFSSSLLAGDWNWFPFPALESPMEVTAKIRHSRNEAAATVYPREDGTAEVVFAQPQRAVTPGQAVVLYQGEMVAGGGTILSAGNECIMNNV